MISFRFAQITDSHLYSPATDATRDVRDDFCVRAIRECAAHDVDFIVHTGDFVGGHCTTADHQHFKELCEGTGVRIHFVRGNHDAAISDEQYAGVYGDGTHWFAHKGWAFLGIDRYFQTYEHTQHAYCLSADTLDKLAALVGEIPGEMPLVAMVHDDPIGISRYHRGLDMWRLLKTRNLRLLLFGHVQSSYIGGYEGVPFVTVTGDDRPHDASPLSYNIVTCHEDGKVSCRFHPYAIRVPARPAQTIMPHGGRMVLDGDWLDLRGPQGTRVSNAVLPATTPKMAWCAELPGGIGIGAPTLFQHKLVISTVTRGNLEECVVYKLDAVTGKVLWTRPVDGSVEGGVLLRDGRGYCGTTAGSVYCLDLNGGQVVWQWNNRDNMPIVCEPTLDDGLVHCGANWEMYALDAVAGKTVWRKIATTNGFTYMGPGNASPLVLDDRVYHQRPFNAMREGQGLVQSVEKATGKNLRISREHDVMHPMHRHASPVLYEGKIYAVGNGLFAFEPDQPAQPSLWFKHDNGSATPAIHAGVAYVSYHKEIVAYDLRADGKVLWTVPHEPALYHFSGSAGSKWGLGEPAAGAFSAPFVAGDKLLVGDTGGHCRCLSVENGRELWRLSVGSPILSAPIISGNALFFGDYDGRLYAFSW